MTKQKYFLYEEIIKLKGEDVTAYRIVNDVNGNRRYVVHFLTLDVKREDYRFPIEGLTRYTAKWFGGGYVIQSANIQMEIDFYYNKVREFYGEKFI